MVRNSEDSFSHAKAYIIINDMIKVDQDTIQSNSPNGKGAKYITFISVHVC